MQRTGACLVMPLELAVTLFRDFCHGIALFYGFCHALRVLKSNQTRTK